jgi:hypothetical protein
MTKEEKEKIVKKIVYEFKKFARQHNFWEEYKRLSVRYRRDIGIIKQASFIDWVRESEPVKLIQAASVFCCWPDNWSYWSELSKQWAYFCLTNGLFYNEEEALDYVTRYISVGVVDRYKKEKKELQLKFK